MKQSLHVDRFLPGYATVSQAVTLLNNLTNDRSKDCTLLYRDRRTMAKSILTELLKKNKNTTFGEFFQSMTPKEKKQFEAEYKEFLVSEMLIAAMQNDDVSVKELAKMADVAPIAIEGLHSGNISINDLTETLKPFGFSVALVKGDEVVPFDNKPSQIGHLIKESIINP